MRIALVAAALLAATPVPAATIEGDLAFACRALDDQKRIDRASGAGDRDGVIAIVKQLMAAGRCEPMPEGTRIRVEDNSFPYACVARFGSAEPCLWVRQRYVNVRN